MKKKSKNRNQVQADS